MKRHLDWRGRLYRWRRWMIAAVIIAAVRVLLPLMLLHVIASQASQILHARVEVADVDLALFKGGVALRDVGVFPDTVATNAWPLVSWKVFAIQLDWLSLLHKTIRLKEVVLDAPYVSLERLQDGGLNLAALLPKASAEPTPAPTPAAEPPAPGWGFAVDRIVLRGGNLHFRDLLLPGSEPVEIALPEIEAHNIAVRPGLYGQPAQGLIELKVDDGVLRIDASATMRADGIAAETHVHGERLPLRRTRLYIPRVGWSDLRGTVSLDMTHHIDTNGSRHDIRGAVGLQDVTVHVPGFADTALAWRALNVEVDPVDLIAQRVTVAKIALDGLSLPVRTGGPEPLPVLRALLASSSAAVPLAAAPPSPVPSAAPPAPAKSWHWALTEAQLTDAKLLVLHNTGRLDVGVAAAVHHLADEAEQPGTAKLTLSIGDGSVDVDGALRVTPLGFGGRIVVDKLNLPDVVTASSAVSPTLLPAARLGLDLKVDAGSLAPTSGDLEVRGTIAVSDGHILPATPTGLDVGVGALDVACEQLHVAGILAAQPGPNRGDVDLRGKISLAALHVTQPGQPDVAVRSLDVGLDELHVTGMGAAQRVQNQGDVRLRGKVSIVEPVISTPGVREPTASIKALDLTLDDVTAPALLAASAAAERAAPVAEIRIRGKLNVSEPRVVGVQPKEFAVGANSIEVGIDEALVPNPRQPTSAPLRVRLGAVRLAAPNVQVTRTKDGIVLPQLTGAAASPQSSPPATPQPNPSAAASAAPRIEVSLASFQLTQGRVAFTDRAVKPFYSGLIEPLDVDLKKVSFPPLAINRVRMTATIAPQGTLHVAGSANPNRGSVEVNLDNVALTPFNPYASTYSPYGIGDGSVSLKTTAALSANGYTANNSIVLHNLAVTGTEGDSLFQQNFGIPLSVALALLKDLSGNITLDVPITGGKDGLQVGIGTVVAGALRSALVGALASPLKLIGMAVGGGTAQSAAPPAIAFRVGRAEPTADSAGQINKLAAFVAGRPGIGVTLEPVPSSRDVRWLREQALAQELGQPQGLWGAVKNIGTGGKRERIAKALAARASDQPGELDEEDGKTMDAWLEQRPAPGAPQLQQLAEQRVAYLERLLREDYGIDPSRITHGEARAAATDDAPTVRLLIGPRPPSSPPS